MNIWMQMISIVMKPTPTAPKKTRLPAIPGRPLSLLRWDHRGPAMHSALSTII